LYVSKCGRGLKRAPLSAKEKKKGTQELRNDNYARGGSGVVTASTPDLGGKERIAMSFS